MNKKALIIGPESWGYTESVEKAFQKIGYIMDIIATKNIYSGSLLKRAKNRYKLLFNPEYYENLLKVNQFILKKYNIFKPDIVMVIKGNMLTKDTIKKMKESKIILWMMDSVFRVKRTYENINLYDYRFMFEKTDIERLKREGIESFFLPLALDESVYFSIKNQEKDVDLLFVGNLDTKRLSILENLIKDFPKLNIQIYGGYVGLIPSKRHFKYYFKGYKKYFKNKNITPSEVNILYSRTKIAINIHHNQSKYGCNPRFFEILGTKTFQLVDNDKFIDEYFSGKVITYENYNDLKNKTLKYLSDESSRSIIIEKGYQEVIKNHTFTQRIKYILSKIN